MFALDVEEISLGEILSPLVFEVPASLVLLSLIQKFNGIHRTIQLSWI